MNKDSIIPRLPGALFLLAMASLTWFDFPALASQSPPGCSANNLIVNIGKSANNVTNGTTVTFTVTVQNPAGPQSCNLTLGPGGLVFTPPGPDGLADGTPTTLIPGNTEITNGYGPIIFSIPSVIFVTNNVITVTASVEDPAAVLHD